jgi:hypothetical protein
MDNNGDNMETNAVPETPATRTMQYAVAEAARKHEEREKRIAEVADYIKAHPETVRPNIITHFAEQYQISRSGVTNYYEVAQARLNGTVTARAQRVVGGPAKPIVVNGVRYYSNSAVARFLRIEPGTLSYWNHTGKGIKSSTVVSPRTGKTYQMYTRAEVETWKAAHTDLLAKVKRTKVEAKSGTALQQKKSTKQSATNLKPLLEAEQSGLIVGARGLAAYFGVSHPKMKYYLANFGKPEHVLIHRSGTPAFGYTSEEADAWAASHSALGLIAVKVVRKPAAKAQAGSASPGDAISQRTLELTQARDMAQAALDAWNERLAKLFSDV